MAEELISSYVDRDGIQGDTEFILKQLNEVLGVFKRINGIKLNLQSDKTMWKEATESIKKYRTEEENFIKIEREIEAARVKRIALESQQAKILVEEKELLRQRNQEVKNSIREQNAATGSIEQLRASLIRLNKEYDNLAASERDASQGAALKDSIKSTSDELKKLEGETGRFQRNVGNYGNAFKGALSTLEDELTKVRQQLSDPALQGKALEELKRQEGLLVTLTAGLGKEFSSTTQQSRAFARAAETLGIELGQDSKAFQAFKDQVGEGADAIKDVKDSVKLAASDTGGIDRLIKAAQGLAGAYAVASGAIQLFGGSEEDAAQATRKLAAVMTVLQGLQAVQAELTNKDSVFRKAATVVQNLWNRAMVEGAVASNVLKIALTGGLLLLLPVLAYAFNKTADKVSDFAAKQKALQDVNTKAAESIGQVRVQIEDLKTKFELARAGVISKKDALKEYNDSLGKTLGATDDLNVAEKRLIENAPKLIQYSFLKAQAQAAGELAAEEAKKSLQDSNKDVEEFLSFGDKLKNGVKGYVRSFFSNDFTENAKDIAEAGLKGQKKAVDEADKNANRYLKLQQGFTKQAAEFAKKNKLNFFESSTTDEDAKKKAQEEAKKRIESERKAALELAKFRIDQSIKSEKEITDSELSSFKERTEARLRIADLESKKVEMQKEFDLKAAGLTESGRTKIIEDSTAQIKDIESNAAKDIISIRGSINKKNAEDMAEAELLAQHFVDNAAETDIAATNKTAEGKLAIIERNAEEEGNVLLAKYKAGKISTEQYEAEKLSIENKARRESLLAEIDHQAEILKVSNLTPEAKAAAEKKLAELKKQLNADGLKDTEETTKKHIELEQKKKDKLIELGNEVKETAFAFLTAGLDQEKAKTDAQIESLEAKKKKDIEVATQSIANQQQRAEAIASIEARSAAEKERLEKRKRQLDQERARYERVKNIADIIQNTAIAVVGALGAKPYGPQNIALAAIVGAIGAAQIARVLATPIPKYAKGTKDHPGGLAIVGDGGKSELVQLPTGETYTTPAKPTLTYLPKHAMVHPDAQALQNIAMRSIDRTMSMAHLLKKPNDAYQFQNMTNVLSKDIKDLGKIIKNKTEVHIKTQSMRDVLFKDGGSFREYLNNTL